MNNIKEHIYNFVKILFKIKKNELNMIKKSIFNKIFLTVFLIILLNSTWIISSRCETTSISKDIETSEEEVIPKGIIALWSGALNTIPTGWALCNGSLGTPDLTNKFIMV